MIKALLWIAAGIAIALQVDKWMEKSKARYSPNAITGTLLDKLNTRLENKRGQASQTGW